MSILGRCLHYEKSKENDSRMEGTNSRCLFKGGVLLIESQGKWMKNCRDQLKVSCFWNWSCSSCSAWCLNKKELPKPYLYQNSEGISFLKNNNNNDKTKTKNKQNKKSHLWVSYANCNCFSKSEVLELWKKATIWIQRWICTYQHHWLTLMVLFLEARLTHTIIHSFIHSLFAIYTKFYNATTCCWLQLDFSLPRLPKWTSQETLRLYTKRPFK